MTGAAPALLALPAAGGEFGAAAATAGLLALSLLLLL